MFLISSYGIGSPKIVLMLKGERESQHWSGKKNTKNITTWKISLSVTVHHLKLVYSAHIENQSS